MKPTLFLLAAGMGSRYGGLKQLDGLGPNGETIMDYSIYDAINAGFGKLVFVIRKDFEKDFRDKIISKYPDLIKQAPPLWNFEPNSSWTTIYPLPEDVKLLVSTAYYSDVVVNLGSTMAFDFGMFDKPCAYINYDQENKVNSKYCSLY